MNRCIRKGCVDFLKSEEGGKEESKVGREEPGKESNKTGGNAGQAWVPEKKRKHLHPSWYLPVTTPPHLEDNVLYPNVFTGISLQ